VTLTTVVMDAQDRLAYLQYLAPGIVAVYYLLTICSSIARVGTDKVQPQTRLRITVLGASCVVFITYVGGRRTISRCKS